MDPSSQEFLAALGTAIPTGVATVYFCLRWVQTITQERTNERSQWIEYLKTAREQDRETQRLLFSAVADLARISERFADASDRAATESSRGGQ